MHPVTRGRLRFLWARALDFILPPQCIGCGQEGSFLCIPCQVSLPLVKEPHCQLCAGPLDQPGPCQQCALYPLHIEGIRAPFRMDGLAREVVHRLKYGNLRALAPLMGVLMARSVERYPVAADVVVPVPLHPKRERQRGYNQSLLLAREVARHLDLPLENRSLVRVRDTPPQVKAEGMEARRANVAAAFEVRRPLGGLRVLLVDDVCTTGATLEACALALKAAAAGSVWGLAFAR